jgi:hypothetical protein
MNQCIDAIVDFTNIDFMKFIPEGMISARFLLRAITANENAIARITTHLKTSAFYESAVQAN